MTTDPPASDVCCPRCGTLLARAVGDLLDLGTAYFNGPIRLICKRCKFVRRACVGEKRVDNKNAPRQTNE